MVIGRGYEDFAGLEPGALLSLSDRQRNAPAEDTGDQAAMPWMQMLHDDDGGGKIIGENGAERLQSSRRRRQRHYFEGGVGKWGRGVAVAAIATTLRMDWRAICTSVPTCSVALIEQSSQARLRLAPRKPETRSPRLEA
jgi:hypothetical protein